MKRRDWRLLLTIMFQVAALVSGVSYYRALGERLRAEMVFPSMAELWLLPVCAGSAVLALVIAFWAWIGPAK